MHGTTKSTFGPAMLLGALTLGACGGDGDTPSGDAPMALAGSGVEPVDDTDTAVAGDAAPSAAPARPPEALLASWVSQAEPGSTCTLEFGFDPDYRFSSAAAEERRIGFYGVDAEPNGTGRRRLQLTFTGDNGQPDCLGSTDDESGQRFLWWIELDGLNMGWFDGPDAGAAHVRDWTLNDGAER